VFPRERLACTGSPWARHCPNPKWSNNLEEFIAVADRLDPSLLGHLLDDIDIALCPVHWPNVSTETRRRSYP
jgi:hypothetical protein